MFKKKWFIVLFVIIGIGVVVQIPQMLSTSSEIESLDKEVIEVENVEEVQLKDESEITSEEYIEYTDWARNIVSNILDSPNKLKFPVNSINSDEWKVHKEDGVFKVQSHVDGLNGFGVKVRERFQVDIDMEKEEVLRVIIGDEVYK